MSSTRDLYERFRHLIHEGAKFLVVGGIGAVVTIAGAYALHGVGKYKAVTIATIVATIVTYVGNRYWTFRHRQSRGTARDTSMFFILNGVGLLIYYACIWVIQDVAGLSSKTWYAVALVVGTGLGTLFRFWSYRRWVWTATDAAPPPVEPGPEIVEVLEEDLAGAAHVVGRDSGRPAVSRRQAEGASAGRAPGAHRRT